MTSLLIFPTVFFTFDSWIQDVKGSKGRRSNNKIKDFYHTFFYLSPLFSSL